jgi:predicted HicB family RNase H-like nuclease
VTEKRKRGRPPGTTGAGRTALLRVRVSPEERDAWQAAAELEGVPLSEWVRSRLTTPAKAEKGRER